MLHLHFPPDLVPVGNGKAFLSSGTREVERDGKREIGSKSHISSAYLHFTNTISKTLQTVAFPTQYACVYGSRDPAPAGPFVSGLFRGVKLERGHMFIRVS